MSPIEILKNCYLWREQNDKSGNMPPWKDVEVLISPDQMDTVSIAINAMTAYADQERTHLQAENEELRKQVSALTQALETQKRENQPYIKELERQRREMIVLLKRCINTRIPEGLHDDISEYFVTINATGGDKPE